MVAWLLAAGLLAAALGLRLLPKGDRLSLDRFPSLPFLYLQVVVAVLAKEGRAPSTAQARRDGRRIEVSLAKPAPFSTRRLASFLRLAGYGEMGGAVPMMYPIVESFRLSIQALVLPGFPFSVLRTVLKSITTVMHREVRVEERLCYKIEIDPSSYTTTDKGHIEVDIVSSGTSSQDQALVWKSVVRAVVLNPTAPKGKAAAAPGQATEPPLLPESEVIDTWRHEADVGRRYGWLNGDLNLIHLHAALSKLFGFKRPIAHALFQLACTEASLRKRGLRFEFPLVMAVECKRPTLLPATLHCALRGSGGGAGAPVNFAVLTQDLTKEVLVGSLARAEQ